MKKLLLFCLLIIIPLFSSCRKGMHTANPILLLADSLMQSRPDSSLYLLEHIPNPQEMKDADCALYNLLFTQAKYKNCVSLKNDSSIQIAIDYYKNNRNEMRLAKSYFCLGCVYLEQKNLPVAINSYLKAVETMPMEEDSLFSAMIYSHLGDCYNVQNLTQTAISMYKRGYKLCSKHDSVRIYYFLKNIGDAYLMEYQFDSTSHYYQQALSVALTMNDIDLTSAVYKNMATLYNKQGRYTEAEGSISKALSHLSNEEDYTSACSIKGDILSNSNRADSAIFYWNIGKKSSDIHVKASSYLNLFKESKKMKDWKDAVIYADSFIVFYDSINTMSYRAELDSLMDNHMIELYKIEFTNRHRQIINVLVVVFILLFFILIILHLWRDRCRKKRILDLQCRLSENRVETVLINDDSASTLQSTNIELHRLEQERIEICMSLFEITEGYTKLNELKKTMPKERIVKAKNYRQIIVRDIRKTFVDVMANLKINCMSLTNDDLLYCVLILIQCPKEVIMDVMDSSSDAIKSRKNRIKNKMSSDFFESIFH